MSILSYGQIKQYALNAGFTGDSANTITAIAMAESGGNPYNINSADPGGSYGLVQVNANAWGASYAQATLGNPQQAMNDAYTISKGGTDFTPWSTYTAPAGSPNSYQNYLPQAAAASASGGTGGSTGTGITYSAPSNFGGSTVNTGTLDTPYGGGGETAPGTTAPDPSTTATPSSGGLGAAGQAVTGGLQQIGAFFSNWAVRIGLIVVGVVLLAAAAHALSEGEIQLPKALPIPE